MPVSSVGAATLRAALEAGGEIALVDVREERLFADGHILTASQIALSCLELELSRRAPCRATRLVLCDGGEGLAERAAPVAEALGYHDVVTLDGGMPAWADAGYHVWTGLNVPGKTLGEVVDQTCATPFLEAAEVKARVDAGDDLIILDSRPWDEYTDFNIPGGVDCPGAELAYRVRDLAPDPSTTVIVNCAGRTRSIIGCQSLVNAGVPNPVFALLNGTIGWEQAGLSLEHGADRNHGDVSNKAVAWSAAAAGRLAERSGVESIDHDVLNAWLQESKQKTLYCLDVRSPSEFNAGHLPGSVSAPGGQLVQGADDWIAVRDGRIVLIDDTGVRANMTASWLKQMGHPRVAVLQDALQGVDLETGPVPLPVVPPTVPGVVVSDVLGREGDVTILDLSHSLTFFRGHAAGALWTLRSRLEEALKKLPDNRPIVVMDDRAGALAAYAVADLQRKGRDDASVLASGLDAWRAGGGAVASGLEGMLTAMDDCYHPPAELIDDPAQADRDYIAWEVTLVEQLERDGLLRFSPLT
ncbi:MAG: rhodanese-like domain-containing protein [Pseudomonadota bacterium]